MGGSISLSRIDGLRFLNGGLDQAALRGRVNEPFLDQSLHSLDDLGRQPRFLHWLTLARITELTLWCAAGYADSGWFTATGDLLFNPRRKFLSRKNSSELIELDRHRPISEQAGGPGADCGSVIYKLKKEFRLVIEKKALMPELLSRLKSHPLPSQPYLKQVESRMTRISSTLSFQATLNLPPGMEVETYLRLLGGEQRALIESQLCRFDLALFHKFGDWIETNLGRNPVEVSGLAADSGKASQQAA